MAEELISRWVRPEIRGLQAYHVPDAAGLVKLDAMENPYGWPESLVGAWLETLKGVSLNRYPDPQAGALKTGLRRAFALPEDMELLLGNGSDELIQMILMAVVGPDRTVLAPEPAFSMYRLISATVGLRFTGVPLSADFRLDLPALLEAIERERPAVVFLAYPSNPTGNLFDAAAMEAVIKAAPGLVVVDEAYTPFCDASFLGRLGRYGNLLVLRTLSKLGLAGLRLGYLVGDPAWLHELDKLRLPYNINVLTQASAAFALAHFDVLAEQTRRIRADRDRLAKDLAALPGVQVFPSQANFILFRGPAGRAPALFEALKARGVLIKRLHGAHPLLADCLRVTVGRPEENSAFLAALAAALAGDTASDNELREAVR
ncbi:MAG TPA: histidinol-phosphate transaminase [Gammaproteobacteria bacterium]|nr:histidinol-phosphate transaminase [Gammaproteobacteria bacterium]